VRWTAKEESVTVRIATLIIAVALFPTIAFAHCDTLSGPVVADAKQALATNNVTPVLKWLKDDNEPEVRQLFERTVKVRQLSPEAQQLADRFFFETVVRLHRAGEGAPFTGLRSENPEPVIQLTDEALSGGSPENLLKALNSHLKSELTKKFDSAKAAKSQSGTSVQAGRKYVAAYVELTHYVERIHGAVVSSEAHAHAQE
jgi:hypothetical protein